MVADALLVEVELEARAFQPVGPLEVLVVAQVLPEAQVRSQLLAQDSEQAGLHVAPFHVARLLQLVEDVLPIGARKPAREGVVPELLHEVAQEAGSGVPGVREETVAARERVRSEQDVVAEEEQDRAGRFLDGAVARRRGAAVGLLDDPQPAVPLRPLAQERSGPVRRAVVDRNHLEAPAAAQVVLLGDAVERLLQDVHALEGRQHDREARRRHRRDPW